jgi:hypothetical protein
MTQDAARLFEQAYELHPDPDILFNMCQARRQLRQYRKAIFLCKSYLRNKPGAANREDVAALIVEMERLDAAQQRADRSPPEGVRRPSGPAVAPLIMPEPWYADRWGWVTAGSGTALLLVGTGAFLWAGPLDADARATVDAAEALSLHEDADTRRLVGAVSTVAGGVAFVAGVAMLVHQSKSKHEAAAPARVVVGPGWLGIQGRF